MRKMINIGEEEGGGGDARYVGGGKDSVSVTMSPLTAPEMSIVKRGRNCVKSSPSRFNDKEVYQDATSLECLVGYLWLKEPEGDRFREVAGWIRGEIKGGVEGD